MQEKLVNDLYILRFPRCIACSKVFFSILGVHLIGFSKYFLILGHLCKKKKHLRKRYKTISMSFYVSLFLVLISFKAEIETPKFTIKFNQQLNYKYILKRTHFCLKYTEKCINLPTD